MSARRLLRIVLSLLIVAVVWIRTGREYHSRSGSWLAGAITLSAILILVVIADITGALQKSRRPRDEVPKRPLGLDA
jgi:hypothetical protein